MWHHLDTNELFNKLAAHNFGEETDSRFLQNNITTAAATTTTAAATTATAAATTTTTTTATTTATAAATTTATSSSHLFLSGLRHFNLVQLHFHHLTRKQFYQATCHHIAENHNVP